MELNFNKILLEFMKGINEKDSQYKEILTASILEKWICEIGLKYSGIVIQSFGNSVLGRPLYELKIGTGETKLHINAAMHANEWLNTCMLMDWIDHVAYHLFEIHTEELVTLFNDITLSIVPLVNPDGVDLVNDWKTIPPCLMPSLIEMNHNILQFSNWKANIRGVDLNNQFDAKWEDLKYLENKTTIPGPRDFPGNYPISEPEAKSLAELTVSSNFDAVLALHSQGQEFYWGFNDAEPKHSQVFAELLQAVSDYKAVRTLKSYGGYKDWVINSLNKPGYTFEIGWGINPLPLSHFDKNFLDLSKIILAFVVFYV